MSMPLLIAVDGGNSKTELALLRGDGEVLSLVRGPFSSPHHLGLAGALDVIDGLLDQAAAYAGLPRSRPLGGLASMQLAGLDLPSEVQAFEHAARRREWADELLVGNDTFALLRAGSERGWGVAVVCGAGINCVGVAPDGRHARFPALGDISGDWGGGYDLGIAALAAAARSEDGRGPRTRLESLVPAHFGLQTPLQLAEAMHLERIDRRRLVELAPLLLRAAGDDAVAAEIVDRLAREVVTLARAALERLGLLGQRVEIVLGGGVLAGGNPVLIGAVEAGLRALSPELEPRVADGPPIVGAALLALDEMEADEAASLRARRELRDAACAAALEAPHNA